MKFVMENNASEKEIRDYLVGRGVQALRRMAGYIPDVMPLDDEPRPMVSDWRTLEMGRYVSSYHFRWLELNYGYDGSTIPMTGFVDTYAKVRDKR